MILNICSEFPDMYIMKAVIGRALTGARATSQAFLILSVSVSEAVGSLRVGWNLEEDICFWKVVSWWCGRKGEV